MLARHAESLFWAGRYLERAEDAARLLDVTYHGQLQAMPWEASRAWSDLLSILRIQTEFLETDQPASAAMVSSFVVHSDANPSSVARSIVAARDNVKSVRELVPTELWEALNAFHLELQGRDLRGEVDDEPHALYDHVKRQCQTIAGVAAETMARDEGWQFLQLGWMLERAEQTCRLLDARYSQMVAADADGGFHHWLLTLKSAAGSETFRRTYLGSIDHRDVVEFLLLSETFPRSVYFCLSSAESAVRRMPRPSGRSRPERLLGLARSELQFLDLHELLEGDLHAYLSGLQHDVGQIAEAVAAHFFRNSEETDLHALDRNVRY